MAHSIRLEELYHIRQLKNFRFFVSVYLNLLLSRPGNGSELLYTSIWNTACESSNSRLLRQAVFVNRAGNSNLLRSPLCT